MPPFSSFFVDKSLVENNDSSNNAASNFSQHEMCYALQLQLQLQLVRGLKMSQRSLALRSWYQDCIDL